MSNAMARFYHQVVMTVSADRVDLRSHVHEPAFKDAVFAMREAKDLAYVAFRESWSRNRLTTYRRDYEKAARAEHRLRAAVGLDARWHQAPGFYDVPLLDDLHTYLTFEKEYQ